MSSGPTEKDGPAKTADTVSGAGAMVDALTDLGVSHWFTNFGSDHPALIEALAARFESGATEPRVLICPHENTAMSAAHGYALCSGTAQAVVVHCDVGTMNLGGSVHNAARARVPAFIFAGETPFTSEGELAGARNRPVQHLQDARDQHGILRPYMKWSGAIRSARTANQPVGRALQIANSEPKGPVYLTAAREYLAESAPAAPLRASDWSPAHAGGLPPEAAAEIVAAMAAAKNPLIITSYVGRKRDAVAELVRLAESLAAAVVEASPTDLNFPADHPLHQGYLAEPLLASADVILVIDCDVPWMAAAQRPGPDSRVFFLDVDPLKEGLLAWHMSSQANYRVDSYQALRALNMQAAQLGADAAREQRRSDLAARHAEMRRDWQQGVAVADEVITPELLAATLKTLVDEDAVVLDETITNTPSVLRQLARTRPGTYFTSGGSSLGWNGGAAIGVKLAQPDSLVLNLTGDGAYLFSVPSSAYWTARKYQTPFLTVIFNNRGWNATKQNVLRLHPGGAAERTDHYWINFDQPADLPGLAAAGGGAKPYRVERAGELEGVLREALAAVRGGQVAVVDVQLRPASEQKTD